MASRVPESEGGQTRFRATLLGEFCLLRGASDCRPATSLQPPPPPGSATTSHVGLWGTLHIESSVHGR